MTLRSIAQNRLAALRRDAGLNSLAAPLAGFCLLVLTALLLAGSFGAADPAGSRIPFQIATGTTGGAFFPVGEAIAGLISHPAGVDRCARPGACGPAGLIITAHSSPGTVDNVLAVNDGTAESGLARADVVAAAAAGQDQFRHSGKASHVRVIASLFSEDVHVIVAASAKISSVADLRGKRVCLGSDSSGVGITAHEILAAYGVPQASLKIVHSDLPGAVQMLQAGKLDAVFTVGTVPVAQVSGALTSGKARLLPIDGAGRDRLLKLTPSLAKGEIAAGAYSGQAATQTVSTQAVWIVRDSVPEALVYGITRALFDPANRDSLTASHPAAHEIGLATAARNPPALLHPGAARFYREMKVIN